MRRVGIISYGAGNLASVSAAFVRVSAETVVIDSPSNLRTVTHIVLPGVGAYRTAMEILHETKLDIEIKRQSDRGIPILGLCLGMHLLTESGNEFGTTTGLGLIKGRAERFQQSGNIKIPHIGWNTVETKIDATLFEDIESSSCFYFNNSYCCTGIAESNIAATFNYGGSNVAAIENGNIFGVQFHPEKSQAPGLRILSRFLSAKD